jgi:hypothetical protein
MAAAQLNVGIGQLNDQHSVKAMLLQKHLNELEKYQQNQNSNEHCQIQEIDETGRIESGNDSGCENYSDRKSDNDSSNHSRTRSISPISDEDTGAPQTKRSKMIDVVTVDQVSPITNAQRNVFSIRNLIYSKDTSDSDTDNHSEDSGNAPSASNGSSPPRPWSPDQEILRKLKEDLSTTLHQFVDTVVQDVVAKVASNYRETLSKQKASSAIQPKEEPKAIMSSEEKTSHCLSSTSALSPASSAVANSISASVGQQLSQVSQQQQAAAAASQRAQQIHQLRQAPSVNPTSHHSVLHQQAALAVRQSPLFLPREARTLVTPPAYPYLSAVNSNYPYSTQGMNPILPSQDSNGYRRPFLSIDPLTGRIKSEHDFNEDSGMLFGGAPQEGLTPHHLKKAKLMFFYCRYPSSNVLKTYFPDVKFNRATTSQLIKWFSNFREFFYIQIEKYSRQALSEGVEDAAELRVTRDCELFKALNNHYNKTNEFEVPDEFLEVGLLSLREFYVNIKEGRDADPSWKKAIYKIICKSDTEIPESFKSATFLTDVAH